MTIRAPLVWLVALTCLLPLAGAVQAQTSAGVDSGPMTAKSGVVQFQEISGSGITVLAATSKQRGLIAANGAFSPVAVSGASLDIVYVVDDKGQPRACAIASPHSRKF